MNDVFISQLVKFISNPLKFFSTIGKGGGFKNFAGTWLDFWEALRTIIIVIDTIILVALILTFLVSFRYRPNLRPTRGAAKKSFTLRDAILKERWSNVLKKAAAGSSDALKVAVIDADKIVDDALKQLGLQGEHMADRLEKLSPHEVRSLDKIWSAHRLRNDLVHTPGFEAKVSDARRALEGYESFLKEVKLLQ